MMWEPHGDHVVEVHAPESALLDGGSDVGHRRLFELAWVDQQRGDRKNDVILSRCDRMNISRKQRLVSCKNDFGPFRYI